MTDPEWDACTDVMAMCRFVEGRADDRKLNLFAAACCRRAWHLMADPRHAAVVEVAERLADGLATPEEFAEAYGPILDLWRQLPDHSQGGWGPPEYMTGATRHLASGGAALYAASYVSCGIALQAGPDGSPAWEAARDAEAARQAEVLRDIVGRPSRPIRFDPAWLVGPGKDAVALAEAIYRGGRFSDLPALADALEAAGSTNEAVLGHCRGRGPHVRGCHVVDALLGREAARAALLTDADWRGCGDPGPLLRVLRGAGSVRRWRLFAVACCRRVEHLMTDDRSRDAVEVAARHADGLAIDEELDAARHAAQGAEDAALAAEEEAFLANLQADTGSGWSFLAAAPLRCRWYAAAAARRAVCIDPRVPDPGTLADLWQPANELAAQAAGECVYATVGCEIGDPGWREAERAVRAADAAELRAQCDLLRDLFGGWLGPVGELFDWLPGGLREGIPRQKRPEVWCRLPAVRPPFVRPAWLAWGGETAIRLARAVDEGGAYDLLPILADALEDAGCDDAELLGHLRGPGPHVRGCWALDVILEKQ